MLPKNKGFTLVELAIVIVIIGLLTVGILQGSELIKASRISNTISKIKSYDGAVATFRAKYNQLPGDIQNPGKFGLNTAKGDATVNVCYTVDPPVTASVGGAGNGNNILSVGNKQCAANSYGGLVDVILSTYNVNGELLNFFVHLSNAQLVKDSFSQANASNWGNVDVGVGVPATSVGIGMIALTDNGSTFWALGTSASVITATNAVGNNLSPLEAYTIDSKLDDGNPTSGSIQAVSAYNNSAFTTSSASATGCVFTGGATYNSVGTYENSKLCTLKILGSF